MDLLDVNVWLAMSLPGHPHHEVARDYWFHESLEEIAFCRVTSLGFMRLLTQPAVTGGEPLTVAQAWVAYRDFRLLPEVILLAEPEGCEKFLESWAVHENASKRLWTDAYLASFARAAASRLVTLDKDFERFRGLDVLLLES